MRLRSSAATEIDPGKHFRMPEPIAKVPPARVPPVEKLASPPLAEAAEGHVLAGVVLDNHRFLGRVRIRQLRQMAPDPREEDGHGQELRELRDDVQRRFDGAKARNVAAYSAYVADIHRGDDGLTPPIILYTEQRLQPAADQETGLATLLVPWSCQLVAIDGEAQLAARYDAANSEPDTQDGWIAVYICHGLGRRWARQAFHDLNVLGVRPGPGVSIGMDTRDPLTRVARQIESRIPFFRGRVSMVRHQLRASDPEIVTLAALRAACLTFAGGIAGLRSGFDTPNLTEERQRLLRDRAIDWFAAVAEAIGPALEDRGAMIAASPPALAAIGAIGHELLQIDDAGERRWVRIDLVQQLQAIDWSRGPHWQGIAGRRTRKGGLVVGGLRAAAPAIYAALTDEASPLYRQVRSGPAK